MGSRSAWMIALLGAAGVVALTLLARGAPGPVALGTRDPGPMVQILVTISRLTVDIAAAMSVGSLAYVLLCTLPSREGSGEAGVGERASAALVRAARWSRVWQVAAFAALVLSALNDSGLSLAGGPPSWIATAVLGEESPYWLAAAVGAGVVALLARYVRGWRNVAPVLALALLSVLPPLFAGHASSDTGHDWTTAALVLHVPAALLWVGLLAQISVDVLRGGDLPSGLLRRYQYVAWAAWLVLGGTGAVLGIVLSPASAASGPYPVVLGAKIALFVLLGLVAATWRRRRVQRRVLGSGTSGRRALLRLLRAEGLLLGAALLGAAELTTLTPPAFTVVVSDLQTLIGYDLPGRPTLRRLVLAWRPEIVFVVLSLGLALWYLTLVVRLRRSGAGWPWGRTVAWLTGCATLLVATSSGLGLYEPVMFSIHMTGHMLLALVGPMLLSLGGPLALARLAVRPRDTSLPGPAHWLTLVEDSPAIRWLTHPVVALGLLAWSPYLIYFGGIFDMAARFHWAHLLLDLYFLLAGYLFAWTVIGVDKTPRPVPSIARLAMLLAALPFNAVFAGLVMSTGTVLGNSLAAGNMYSALQLPWNADLLSDQRLGGLIALIISEIAVTGAIVSLLVRWWKLDEPLFGGGLPLRRPDVAKPQAVGDDEER